MCLKAVKEVMATGHPQSDPSEASLRLFQESVPCTDQTLTDWGYSQFVHKCDCPPDTVDISQTLDSPSLRKSCVSQVLVCAGGSRPPLHPLPPAASLLSLALVTAASSVVLLDPPKVQPSSLKGRRYEVTPGLWPLTLVVSFLHFFPVL